METFLNAMFVSWTVHLAAIGVVMLLDLKIFHWYWTKPDLNVPMITCVTAIVSWFATLPVLYRVFG